MRFVAIDLAQLPPPQAVVPQAFADILAARKQTLLDRIDDPALKAEVAAVLALESEPATKIVEADSYRELIVYQRVNEAVQAVLLASSQGTDLDQLAARLDVQRMTITPATDTAPAVMESDADLKYRYQLAPEAFSVAGPYGAYEFHARSAHPKVKDAAIYGPETGLVTPGQALTVILSRDGDGTPTLEMVDAVYNKLSHEDTVPDTDQVLVRAATIVPYSIHFKLQLRPGADPTLIVAQASAKLATIADDCHRIGRVVVDSALDGAAHFDHVNIIRATKLSPATDVDPGYDGAPYCTNIVVDFEVAT